MRTRDLLDQLVAACTIDDAAATLATHLTATQIHALMRDYADEMDAADSWDPLDRHLSVMLHAAARAELRTV